MTVPTILLKQLYNFSSLKNVGHGIQFMLKNRLSDTQITGLLNINIDGKAIPKEAVTMDLGDGKTIPATQLSDTTPLDFPLRQSITIQAATEPLAIGKHKLYIGFKTAPFGDLRFEVEDAISESAEHLIRIPRDPQDDYAEPAIRKRQHFAEAFTGTRLTHITSYSFDPHIVKGNLEHFIGVAQIPLGIAGPLRIDGEYAQGDFLIPLAATEGTLVASYNRGIKLVNLCGGVKCTVADSAMQRAPVFVLNDARAARAFVAWVKEPDNYERIREEAEATSSVAKLQYIDTFLASKFAYLRFNFSTGDAAGQNMVGRATFAACGWIIDHYPGIQHFFLESNFATDKKASMINTMRTRGKRVTAEAVIKRDILIQNMRVEPESLSYHNGVANVGALMSGVNNNGLHSANAIAALFMATGQDIASVAESSTGVVYTELTPERDLYISFTIPSLIVATHGGGTALATQRECLEMLGCTGRNKVNKLAEIVGGVVLAGELSLAAAISSSDWVSSHERYGRNR
ncbi:MAG: hydroxymethylglutaryl-CoA reductase [Candidatus Competibacteraceae bacterium]